MKIAFFNTKSYDRTFFDSANQSFNHRINYIGAHLNATTARTVSDEKAVCAFINDNLDADTLEALKEQGVKLIALRSAGFNHVDLDAARDLSLPVVRVPAYSPHAVAEHTVGLILALNRKYHKAYNRVKESNFSLEGLLGFDLAGKTIGLIGTGKIGRVLAKIMLGFGCRVLAFDITPNDECRALGVEYVQLNKLLQQSDIISLHCPLTEKTQHIIDQYALQKMKSGVMIINTSRGKLVDSQAVIKALKEKKIGALGLDVYEEEEHLFFENLSQDIILDDTFVRLMTFPNVLITSHQAFFTKEALVNIARTTLANIDTFEKTGQLVNQI